MSRTDPLARNVHGANPQFLINQMTRTRIYDCLYWKEHCFGLNAETLIEKAVGLRYVGGMYGGNFKATPFICLLLKLLQIGPAPEVIDEYIQQTDFKYLQALAAFYLRLTSTPQHIYAKLEELYTDNRLLRVKDPSGAVKLIHMDEFVDGLMSQNTCFGVDLPHLPKRHLLENSLSVRLAVRQSALTPRLSKIVAAKDLDAFEAIELPSVSTHRHKAIWLHS